MRGMMGNNAKAEGLSLGLLLYADDKKLGKNKNVRPQSIWWSFVCMRGMEINIVAIPALEAESSVVVKIHGLDELLDDDPHISLGVEALRLELAERINDLVAGI